MSEKKCNKCYTVKPLLDFTKNKRSKDGFENRCKLCDAARLREYYERKREQLSDYGRKKYLENKESEKERKKLYRLANPHVIATQSSMYRVSRARSVIPCLTKQDLDRIKTKYKEAQWMTRHTGIKHHVDHIIPLKGKLVSGLHVPCNLRVITASYNLSKRNSFAA